MSVAEAKEKVSRREFRQWVAYNEIEPIGEWRQDMRIAMLCCLVANRTRGKGEKEYKTEDFLMFNRPPKRKQTAAEMELIFRTFAKCHNAANKAARKGK